MKDFDDFNLILESIVSFIDEGIIIAQPNGDVLYHNPSAYQLLGLPANIPITSINHLNTINLKKSLVRAAIDAGHADAAGKPSDDFVRFTEQVLVDGCTRYIQFHSGIVRSHHTGKGIRLIIMQDLTEHITLDSVLQRDRQGLISKDPKMLAIVSQIQQIAPTDAYILLQGESGTGKTQLARIIHQGSLRSKAPFVEVNCAAIPESLIESELFGHIKGAFTGAISNRIGRFLSADKGTLFLDEISEIPLHLQAKLLKVLQDQSFEMVGSDKSIHINTRIIAASNKNLRELVDTGKFRADLYYRLAVIPLELPCLHERPGDIPILVEHFLMRLHDRGYSSQISFSKPTLNLLLDYPWPGNVRELENAVEHGVICASGNEVTPDNLPQDIRKYFQLSVDSFCADTAEQQKQAIELALEQAGGNRTLAAEKLGIDRSTLWRRMQKFNL